MKVPLPAVGVMDMLVTTPHAGVGFVITERRRTARKCLVTSKAILPHNVKAGVQYPATMVTTGDHDDRVVPAHSFKFAAELQENKAANKNPNPYCKLTVTRTKTACPTATHALRPSRRNQAVRLPCGA
jgi:prolyl oligopeptidase